MNIALCFNANISNFLEINNIALIHLNDEMLLSILINIHIQDFITALRPLSYVWRAAPTRVICFKSWFMCKYFEHVGNQYIVALQLYLMLLSILINIHMQGFITALRPLSYVCRAAPTRVICFKSRFMCKSLACPQWDSGNESIPRLQV